MMFCSKPRKIDNDLSQFKAHLREKTNSAFSRFYDIPPNERRKFLDRSVPSRVASKIQAIHRGRKTRRAVSFTRNYIKIKNDLARYGKFRSYRPSPYSKLYVVDGPN